MYIGITVSQILEEVDPDSQIQKAFEKAGLKCPCSPIIDGQIHRYCANPEKDVNNQSGWYILYPGTSSYPYPAGAAGDWSRDISVNISTHGSAELTADQLEQHRLQIQQAQQQAEQQRIMLAEKAAKECASLWEKAEPCINHDYLTRKGLKNAHGAKVWRNNIVIPLYDQNNRITSLQYIDKAGNKLYHKYGTIKGSFWQIGQGTPSFLAEGYATACSIYEATGKPCLVAFSAGNLKNVAALFPSVTIIADNDESGTGEKAAQQTGNKYILIPEVGKDANDYATEHGTIKLQNIIENATPKPAMPLFSGTDILSCPTPKNWIIRDWLPKGECLTMCFGQPGNGKTFVVLDQMLHIATGQPEWCGYKVKQNKVLYLCGEGCIDVRARIAVWCQEHHISNLENFYMSEDAEQIDTPDGMAKIMQSLNFYGFEPGLIVVDTLNRFMEGDENATQDATSFIAACTKLQKKYHANVLLVHHTGLSEEAKNRARGSSAFLGALDMQYRVEMSSADTFKVVQTKNKGGKQQKPLFLQLEDYTINGWFDEDGIPYTSGVLTQINAKEFKNKESKSQKQKDDEAVLINACVNYGIIDAANGKCLLSKDQLKQQLQEENPDWTPPHLRKCVQYRENVTFITKPQLLERLVLYGDVVFISDNNFYVNDILVNGLSEPYWSMNRKKQPET